MLVVSNAKVDKWGKYFHLAKAAKYAFPIDTSYDTTRNQKDQLKRLKTMTNLIPLSDYGLSYYWSSNAERPKKEDHLATAGFSKEEIELLDVTMTDYHFEKEVNVIVPYYIATTELKPHLKRIDSRVDYDAQWDFWSDSHPFSFDSIQNLKRQIGNLDRGRMGTGYTDFTSPHDGSASIETAVFEMENGEFLICLVWEWYNK